MNVFRIHPRQSLMEKYEPRKKGKIRETAKQKKPTPLKRVILKEREEKKVLREQHTNQLLETRYVQRVATNSKFQDNKEERSLPA